MLFPDGADRSPREAGPGQVAGEPIDIGLEPVETFGLHFPGLDGKGGIDGLLGGRGAPWGVVWGSRALWGEGVVPLVEGLDHGPSIGAHEGQAFRYGLEAVHARLDVGLFGEFPGVRVAIGPTDVPRFRQGVPLKLGRGPLWGVRVDAAAIKGDGIGFFMSQKWYVLWYVFMSDFQKCHLFYRFRPLFPGLWRDVPFRRENEKPR